MTLQIVARNTWKNLIDNVTTIRVLSTILTYYILYSRFIYKKIDLNEQAD